MIEALHGDVVAAWRQAGQCADQRPGAEGGRHDAQGPRQRQHATGQHQEQKHQRCRRHQRTAQVVHHLPAVNGGQRQAQAAGQEGQQLPVASRPAVQARSRHIGMVRRIFHQRDFTHRRAACQRTFKQIVAEHLAFGQAQRQRAVHRLHVEQALATEAAFAEEVLINLGTGGAVGVQAAVAVEERVVAGGSVGRRQRRLDTRLQDAVAADDAAHRGVPARLVQRVRGHAHQRAQPARWHVRVGVQRDQVAHRVG